MAVHRAELALGRVDQEDPRRGGQVEPEGRALLDDQVLDELAAEQLVEEAAAEALLHLERGPFAEQLEGDQ